MRVRGLLTFVQATSWSSRGSIFGALSGGLVAPSPGRQVRTISAYAIEVLWI